MLRASVAALVAAQIVVAPMAYAQSAGDIVGSWAVADETGAFGWRGGLGFPNVTCNDRWTGRRAGGPPVAGRGYLTIARVGDQFVFAENSVLTLGALAEVDAVAAQVTGDAAALSITLPAGERSARLSRTAGGELILQYFKPGVSSERLARCPDNAPVERSFQSYLTCRIVYEVMGGQGGPLAARYREYAASWQAAEAATPPSDRAADGQAVMARLQQTADEAAALAMVEREMARCGGPAPARPAGLLPAAASTPPASAAPPPERRRR